MDLEKENAILRQENEKLRKLLGIAKNWIEKEVKHSVVKLAKKKVGGLTAQSRDQFFNENVEEIITKRIADFFGEMMIMNTPAGVIDNIISAELNYYNFKVNPIFDGFSVISSYHKALDILIEEFITKGFRSYVMKKGKPSSVGNDALEKSLHSVMLKGYSLSVGRLYHLIDSIKNHEYRGPYTNLFASYLKEYRYISDIILGDLFFENFTRLIETKVLGEKRHIGKIDFLQTREARNFLIGDFTDQNCFIYDLLEIGKSDF